MAWLHARSDQITRTDCVRCALQEAVLRALSSAILAIEAELAALKTQVRSTHSRPVQPTAASVSLAQCL